ncbi:hypothetical protein ETP1_026 [Edwardsiella phage ETP-1]|uniref:Uncharacterized protein n=3 Tax=Kafunavirus KF1 TaxID=1982588 RepID=A0A6G5P4D8_9CAUD|nr:hypothetical protein D877_gp29 [Edwardsiella phage KF-1]QBP07027.1 hypothetical protein ETP1_026 [Edwardsiella phage ETP-1]UIS54083.1 hypothetical protein ZHX_gp23 [Edwardsiella phage vB_EpP_ZHX]BAM63077.1 hypothetical protein [Edwardsiella phage KF-1]BAM63126.1 hypothetical protein [Edwardsiella phage IW-1]
MKVTHFVDLTPGKAGTYGIAEQPGSSTRGRPGGAREVRVNEPADIMLDAGYDLRWLPQIGVVERKGTRYYRNGKLHAYTGELPAATSTQILSSAYWRELYNDALHASA